MKIIAFAASGSRNSINQQLAAYAASLLPDADVTLLDICDYELPLFTQDREKALGQPALAKQFYHHLGQADGIIISFAEHNGSYTAAYKNLFDWMSRIDMQVFQNKPMVLLSTSPGPGGAASVLASAVKSLPYFGGVLTAQLSLSSFYDHFDVERQHITSPEWQQKLTDAVLRLQTQAHENSENVADSQTQMS